MMTLWDLEKEFRGAVADPKNLSKKLTGNKTVGDYFTEMFDTPDIRVAAQKAKDLMDNKQMIVGKFFELDPTLSIPMAMKRVVADVERKSMLDGLRMVSSDISDVAHTIPGSRFGGEIAKMYKDKWFPEEVLTEYKAWGARLKASMEDTGTVGKVYDTVQGLWKWSVTSPWPAFHFRNAVSDLGRCLTNGPFDPIAVHRDGLKAAARGKGMIDLGHFGKHTGADLWDLAQAYRITGGYFEEALMDAPKWTKPLRLVSAGENVRRVGYFADRIRSGFSPAEAAKETLKVFFDYGALAPWEKKWAKRLLPWWNFRRNNMAFQVDRLLQQPYWTAAQLRLIKGRSTLREEDPDWVPDRLQGNVGMVVRENGITSIINGLDIGGVQDLVAVLDMSGHPKGPFKAVLDNIGQEVGPVAKAVALKAVRLVAPGEVSDPRGMVNAPKDIEKLPKSFLDFFEVRQVQVPYRGKVYQMPLGSLEKLKSLRAFSETMKLMRYDNTKTMTENVLSNAAGFLLGISKREITEAQIQEMLMRERLDDLTEKVKDAGYWKGGALSPEGQRTKLGREYEIALRRYMQASSARAREDDKRRFVPPETVQGVQAEPSR